MIWSRLHKVLVFFQACFADADAGDSMLPSKENECTACASRLLVIPFLGGDTVFDTGEVVKCRLLLCADNRSYFMLPCLHLNMECVVRHDFIAQ
jgi:hypothetical protein